MQQLMSRLKTIFFYAWVFSLFLNFLMLIPSLYMMQIFDRVMNSRSVSTLVVLTIGVTIAMIVNLLLEFIRSRLLVAASVVLDRLMGPKIVDSMFEHASNLNAPVPKTGLRDLQVVRNFLTGFSIYAVFDAPWLFVYMWIVFWFSSVLGWAALIGTVFLVALGLTSEAMTRSSIQTMQEKSVDAVRFVESNLSNAEVIRALGMGGAMRRCWDERNMEALHWHVHNSHVAGAMSSMTRFARQMLQQLMICIGVYLMITDQSTSPGVMLAATFIVSRAMMPVEQLIMVWGPWVEAREAYSRLKSLLAEEKGQSGQMELPPPKGDISLENVYLALQDAKRPILGGINVRFPPGESVGIIGASASGKSSLARVLLGIWPPTVGTVRYDGADLSEWPRESLGPYIGYLPQDVELFAGTVAENIARLGELDSDKILAAAQKARVHEMILRLPHGYDTILGQGGIGLSGGQRQRIGLARALYGSPCIVLLDEPNANLDSEGEGFLLETFAQLKAEGVTLLVIAHRPMLLQNFDRLLVMRGGSVEMYGARHEVMARLAPPPTQPVPAG
jgi:PrtD family type I secretion system ABC transporter